MIKGIDNQKVEMSEEEYNYYLKIVEKFTDQNIKGSDYFKDLFETDKNGIITIIKPSRPIPWDVIFFIQNLQQNQHLREFEARIERLENFILKGK